MIPSTVAEIMKKLKKIRVLNKFQTGSKKGRKFQLASAMKLFTNSFG